MCTAVAAMIASVDSVHSARKALFSEQAFDRTPVRSCTTQPRQKRDTFEQMFEQSPSARYGPRDDPRGAPVAKQTPDHAQTATAQRAATQTAATQTAATEPATVR